MSLVSVFNDISWLNWDCINRPFIILTILLLLEISFSAKSFIVGALLSHHSKAHSSCGAPVRQAQMIQLPSLQTACFFLLPFLFLCLVLSISSGNIPVCFSCAPFLFTPPSLPPPIPSPESGRPPRHHSPLSDNWYKGGLGGHSLGRSMCTATGQRVEESTPPLPIPSSPPSFSPPQMMKTLSVWIRRSGLHRRRES